MRGKPRAAADLDLSRWVAGAVDVDDRIDGIVAAIDVRRLKHVNERIHVGRDDASVASFSVLILGI
jgi:hypothetical protein